MRQQSGEIEDIKYQDCVTLGTEQITNARTGKVRTRSIRWKVDFSFTLVKTKERVWCEAKGFETSLYKKQVRLWREGAGPGTLEIWKGSYRRPFLAEIVWKTEVKQNGEPRR